jgi:Uma2 family endonuclease
MTYIPEQNPTIPAYLIYEELNGIPVYYRGYKDVINQTKNLNEIMGYGELQSYILTILNIYFLQNLDKVYFPMVGETGLHIAHNNNLSLDLCIYLRKDFSFEKLENKYINTPPKVVIEVDTKADQDILDFSNYYVTKTQKLLDFGVEQVLWIYTDQKKVMVAQAEGSWLIINWTDEITVLGQTFTIQQIIDEAELGNTEA